MTPHRRRQQRELSLYQSVCLSTAKVEGHLPGLLPGPLVVHLPIPNHSLLQERAAHGNKEMSALYAKILASKSGEKNVLNRGADTQKCLLCGGEKGKGEI